MREFDFHGRSTQEINELTAFRWTMNLASIVMNSLKNIDDLGRKIIFNVIKTHSNTTPPHTPAIRVWLGSWERVGAYETMGQKLEKCQVNLQSRYIWDIISKNMLAT
jgi:hypothetical protein